VKRRAREDMICQRFMTTPGVGPVTALTFKAAVDDPVRFKRSRTVAAHFGLTPRRFQSGETDNLEHISKAGDGEVRATLYAAANTLMTRTIGWSSLKAWGMTLMKTKGRRKAVVAVARKLAVILHRMARARCRIPAQRHNEMAARLSLRSRHWFPKRDPFGTTSGNPFPTVT